MGSIVLYIIEWAFALLVLIAIYKAAFSGTTLHRFNRFYLLGATLLSALLPLVHVTITDSTPVAAGLSLEETYFARELSGTFTFAPEPETMWADASDLATPSPDPEHKTSLWAVMLIGTYSIYVLTLIIGWSRGIIRARKFLHGKPRRRLSRTVWLVTHSEQYGPFSWMNYIVISDSENGFARRASLRHEYSHVKLLHSIDLVVLLACTIVNPVCWLVLQEIKIVHEYEADDEVINRYGIQEQDYQRLLLIKAVGAEAYALASSFNLNIKKRIIMMNKNKTRKSRLIWLLLLVPMLGVTSVLFARTEKAVNLDDKLRFSSTDAEMSVRLPEPASKFVAMPFPHILRVIGDDEVISDEDRKDGEMIIRRRNLMTIQINRNNEIYVKSGIMARTVTVDELKDLARQFIQNPDNDSRLPVIEDYEIEGYGTVQTTVKHVFSLDYDRSASSAVLNDVRYELQKAYNELRDELCLSRFGKNYDQCTDSQQQFARGMYANKISEAYPRSYDAEGNLIQTQVRSAAANPELAKTNKVNKDLRIRVKGAPAWLYVSTVLFDNENGQDRFRSETTPKQISLDGLDDYIDQAISDGMKIRKVRLSMQPDVPMGPIIDLKETVRNRMLLNLVMESYKEPDVMYTDQSGQSMNLKTYITELPESAWENEESPEFSVISRVIRPGNTAHGNYYELCLDINENNMVAGIEERRDGENVILSWTVPQEFTNVDQLEKYIDNADKTGRHIRDVALNIRPDAKNGLVTDIKNSLRKKRLLNIRYVGSKTTGEDHRQFIYLIDIRNLENNPDNMEVLVKSLIAYMTSYNGDTDDLNSTEMKAFVDAYRAAQGETRALAKKYQDELSLLEQNPDMKIEDYEKIQQKYQEDMAELRKRADEMNLDLSDEYGNVLKSTVERYQYVCITHYKNTGITEMSADNLDSYLKDLSNGRIKGFTIPYSSSNYRLIQRNLSREYSDKAVLYLD